jgi:hypothetical protein
VWPGVAITSDLARAIATPDGIVGV